MATSKEIKARIGSVQNTKKITRAMEMISASKMRKARDRMEHGKPYAQHVREVISHLAKAHPEYQHPYLNVREDIKRVGFIVITTDRGLCGGLNIQLFKKAVTEMQEWENKGVAIDVAVVGHKGETFFKSLGANIVSYAAHLGDQPKIADLIGSVKVMLDAYDQGKLDSLYLISNDFDSTIKQTPVCRQLLPVQADHVEDQDHRWDYIYEPEAKELLTLLLVRYIESQVYQAVIENLACEQAARMMAMKNATDNATEVIADLKLQYNKARQAAITKELAEIVSGADAIE